MADYISDYTGSEIDEVIAKVTGITKSAAEINQAVENATLVVANPTVTETVNPLNYIEIAGVKYQLINTTYSAGTGISISDANVVKATGVEYKNNIVVQTSPLKFVRMTQDQYDALSSPDENTFYIIVG